MKKILSIVIFSMLIVSTSWAQSEPKMNYQAVLRDSQNKLVTNTPVLVTLTVQNAAGVAYYTEPQSTVTTNPNGLMTLTFGGGTNWNTVNWKDANLVIDATWGEGNNIKDTVVMTAVPYAYYAENSVTSEDFDILNEKINKLYHIIDSISGLIPTFTCGSSTVKDHQGHEYLTVEINGKCWMAQNLRVTTSPKGNTLKKSMELQTDASYYFQNPTYGNDGYLYNWRAALDTTINVSDIGININIENRRGLCPEGWHLPTESEWASMVTGKAGGEFAAPNGSFTGTDWAGSSNCSNNLPNCNNDPNKNSTGFSAVPAGYLYRINDITQIYDSSGLAGYWTASTGSNGGAYYRGLGFASTAFGSNSVNKAAGFAIRCVRD